MTRHAKSTLSQQVIVAKHILACGSINRYEADALGVCHLAARIKELKHKGFKFNWIDQITTDLHGIEHQGIRRYSFAKMSLAERVQLNSYIKNKKPLSETPNGL